MILITSKKCKYCEEVKKYLDKKGIFYMEIDADSDAGKNLISDLKTDVIVVPAALTGDGKILFGREIKKHVEMS